MGSTPLFTDAEMDARLGWKAYDRQVLIVPVVLLLPMAVGLAAALGARRWVPDQNLNLALTTTVALLAGLHLSDFVDILSGSGPRKKLTSPTRAAHQITGVWAFLAILAILAHFLMQVADGASDGVTLGPIDSLDQGLRNLVRFMAVLLTGASIGMWVSIRWVRGLLAFPDPPVQPSTRLWTGAVDLLVPAVVVLILIRRFEPWFDAWLTSVIAVSAVVAGWQLLLARAGSAGARHGMRTRIVETNWKGDRLDVLPGWFRCALRSSLHGAVVGLPAGIWLTVFIERESLLEADLPPNWLVAGCLVPFLVLLLSIPAHPSGQALHDLLCGTAVFRAPQDKDDAVEAGQREWGPCW